MNVDDQLNEQDLLLLEKVETILAGEAGGHLLEDPLVGFCAQMASSVPKVSSYFKEGLWGKLITRQPGVSTHPKEEPARTHWVSFRRKEFPSLSVEEAHGRTHNLLHTAWGWILPAGAMILIILLISLLLQARPHTGNPAVEGTAGVESTASPTPTAYIYTRQVYIEGKYYIVQEGDSLTAIASQFDVTVDQLLEANRIDALGIPYIGMKLTIPPSSLNPASSDSGYTVREGDTLSGIAKHFGITVEALLNANDLQARGGPSAGMILFIPVIYPGPRDSTYVVQAGDTLTSIADHYGLTVRALLDANRLKIGGIPYAGTTLVIPTTGVYPAPKDSLYVIREGDSLTGVANRFGLTIEALLAANQLTDQDAIQSGQTLFIPLAATPQPTSQPDPETQAILDELRGLVARRRAELLTGPGWIYVHLQGTDTGFCDSGSIIDASRPCEDEEHYWFELNASNEVVSTIYRQVDLSGQVLEEWVKRDGLYRNFTRGYVYSVPLTSTYETDWGFTAQAEASNGGLRKSETTDSGEYQGMLILDLWQVYGIRQAVFDPQTGALLELSSSSSHVGIMKVLAEERVDAPPADALALFDRPSTPYQPRPPQGDPVPAGYDLAHSTLLFKTVGGDDFAAPSFWYADIYAAGDYLVGRVDVGVTPGGYCQRSPDGLKLAFDHVIQAETHTVQQLRWVDLTNPDDVHIVHPEINLSSPPAWDPGSTRLAFAACDESQDCGLYTYDIASGDVQRLANTSNLADLVPAWSPDGSEIAYRLNEGGSWQNIMVDAATGAIITSPGWQSFYTDPVGFSQCVNPPTGVPSVELPTMMPNQPLHPGTPGATPDLISTPTAQEPMPYPPPNPSYTPQPLPTLTVTPTAPAP